MNRIILASGSPRRKVLMQCMGLEFDIVPSNYDEILDDSRPPSEVAIELGFGKADEVSKDYPDDYIIGGDLIIVLDGKQIAKPADAAEAKAMLHSLNNRSHQAVGSVVLVHQNKAIRDSMVATVDIAFDDIPKDVINAYIATGDPYDKAGGYARQHPIITNYIHVTGELNALIGLSTIQLRTLLQKHGITVPNDEAKILMNFKNAGLKVQKILT